MDQRETLFQEVLDEIIGLGPIELFMRDEEVTKVMINGPDQIYIEKNDRILEANTSFLDHDHLYKTAAKMAASAGHKFDENSPTVDARLPDGSRVHIVGAPCAIDGISVTIRKFGKKRPTIDELINFGSLNQTMADYLEACVICGLNILVSGESGSGKSSLLNVLSGFIPEKERIITIEESAELKLEQPHVVRLEAKQPRFEGDSAITMRQLVRDSLRMRPDRVVVGECRGGEALDILQAMNTGHEGIMTTIHANKPGDTLARLETLVLMSGMELPIQVVRKQIASGLHLVIQLSRMRDGSRKITHIRESAGMEGESIVMQDVFNFQEQGKQGGKIKGSFVSSGLRSRYDARLKGNGFRWSAKMFQKSGPSPLESRVRVTESS